jgi:hypothetical protein
VTLRVVGGDEKGSLESETVKYGHESYGTQTRNDCTGEGQQEFVKDRPGLSSERVPQIKKPATVRNNEDMVVSPDGCFIPRQTGQLTVGHNLRLKNSCSGQAYDCSSD